ncbi:DUF6286 domain-containing protein [Streptomyces sp. NPDC048659]|uniref:DUF6286 domain-containing Asp23/Gls24 family envelope stress response protein n=1 Tax=Streptomyces sp. NPDC048659 TaxID=3155489 RepID=UPI00342A832A
MSRSLTGPAVGERGGVRVSDRAVRRIVRQAATEALDGAGTLREPAVARPGEGYAQVRVGIDLAYPADLVGQGERVRRHVIDRASELSGLHIRRADVVIEGLSTAPTASLDLGEVREFQELRESQEPRELRESQEPREGAAAPESDAVPAERAGPPRRVGRRPWSARRLPALALSLVGAATAGALLVRAVRDGLGPWGGRGEVPLSPGFLTAAGAAVALFGLVLLVLAVTPGHRRRLPMASPDAAARATLDRAALALTLRQAVLRVEGVGSVRVRPGCRRVRIRVRTGAPGATDALEAEATRAASDALGGAGLVRAPGLSVKVAAVGRGRPHEDAEGAE